MSAADRNDPTAVYIGKDPARVDWLAPMPTVSSVHLRLRRDPAGSGVLVEDLGSTNGTFIDGAQLAPRSPVSVAVGTTIHLGRTLSFEVGVALLAKLDDPSTFSAPQPLELRSATGTSPEIDLPNAPWSEAPTKPPVTAGVPRSPRRPSVETSTPASPARPSEVRAPVSGASRPSEVRAPVTAGTPGQQAPVPVSASAPTDVPAPAQPIGRPGGDATAPAAAPGGDPGTAPLPCSPPAPGAPSLSIGYSEQNDVVVPNAVVSGRHARIYLDGDRFVLEDQGSTNGTWLGGARVQLAEIDVGQVINLGSYQLVFDDALADRLRARATSPQAMADAAATAPVRSLTVGRDPSNDVTLAAPMVSSRHALIEVLSSGRDFVVTDLHSTNGTYLNSRENRVVSPTTAGIDDILYFGSYRFPLSRLDTVLARSGGSADSLALPGKRRFVIGRDDDVDVAIDQPQISRRHAEVEVLADGRFAIRDLGSSNGTFVNGERIRGRREVTADDRVSLGGYSIRLDADSGVVRQEYHGDMMIQAQRVSIDVRDKNSPGGVKRILNEVSFTAYPTEFVGLMGPSGAGKTTLMMALNGYTPPSTGRSVVNGVDLYENYNSFRGNIGYVPQDDIVYPQLTVYESLCYTARLRLPADTTAEEIDAKITRILEQLEIQQTRDVLIGDALKKGISGGQRKRVNLAQELITEPSLLFLDEPTSGLASEDTINVMRLLRGLADTGKTILLTIHQPSLEAYRMMDNVIYLYQGNLVYYGPAYPDSILFFNEEVGAGAEREKLLADPGNALKPLAKEQRWAFEPSTAEEQRERMGVVIGDRRQAYAESPYYREFVYDRAGKSGADVQIESGGKQKTDRRGLARQWRILTERAARITWKDKLNTFILMAQAPIIAAVLAAVFAQPSGADAYFDGLARGPAALFLLVASAVWFGCSNSARTIVAEQAIYRRERMVNLMIPSYVLSKFTVLGGVCALQCLMLLGIVYGPLGLEGGFGMMYLILLLTSLAGLGMGLMLSALVSSAEAAVALVPLLLIPQIILGGVIMPVHEMGTGTRVLSAAMAARWGYEAMLHVEYADDDLEKVRDACGIPDCVWEIGPTGYTYFSGDPEERIEASEYGGLEVVASLVPYRDPQDSAICVAFCSSVRHGEELTPLDRSFGVDPADAVRRDAWHEIVETGGSPDAWTAPSPAARSSLWAALGVLGGAIGVLLALVMAILRHRDVEVG